MIADAILASDWLADHDAEIREQIAQEIEAGVLPSHPSREYRDGFERAAQIARTSEPTL